MTDKPKPDDQHSEYAEMLPVWNSCRAAKTGQRAVHAGAETYLPRLSGQDNTAYAAYRDRALFFNATGRTVEGMVGLVFRKPPVSVLPEGMKAWESDIDLGGKSLMGFVQNLTEETITVGRGGILVEHTSAPQVEAGTAVTVAEAQKNGLRPYMAYYAGETILNWRRARVGNATKLTNVWLAEKVLASVSKGGIQIRELKLDGNQYIQVVWVKTEGDDWVVLETVFPVKNGKPLTDIPFVFIGPKEVDTEVQNPPIEDLVYVNLSHYKNSADIENGAHISGLPTPYVTGINAQTGPDGSPVSSLSIGSNTAWLIPDPNAKVGYLQVGADGFTSLENLMDRKEQQMAALGARMLSPEKKAAEAAETAGIRRGGENSVLASIAGAVSMQVTKALKIMADWAGVESKDISYSLNKDYLPMPMDSSMLTAWVSSWQSGAISEETFFEGLQAGEIVDEGLTFDVEKERKAESGPALGMMGRTDDSE